MVAWMVAFWVLVALLAVGLVSWLFPKGGGRDEAKGVLRERLARG